MRRVSQVRHSFGFIEPVSMEFPVDEGMTKQEFKDECDINVIMRRFVRDRALSPDQLARRQGMYADVSAVPDLAECLDRVRRAEAGFLTLPARVRERFGNDPGALLVFLADPRNADEARELGLLERIAPGPAQSASEGSPGPASAGGPGQGTPAGSAGVPVR